MERNLFKFIWQHSRTQQITTLLFIVSSFPFLYFSLDLPKTIVNEAIGAASDSFTLFELDLFGFQFDGFDLGQLEFLFSLCGLFLLMVCVNGAFKLKINTYKGVMAERLLRRIRYILLERALRFPLSQFQKTSAGEVVTMVTAEVEPLGGFFGDAYALLAFQGGTFVTIMAFMFLQDPLLGLAAFISIPVQGYVIPKLQKRVNILGKERVKHVRGLSNRIGEVVTGMETVHAHDNSKFILADISDRLSNIFWVRFEIYERKFFIKFLNNLIGQMTPFFFYAVGGYLVIQGDLTFGALVAALAAYKDLAAPWKELLNYYQRMADSKIKYEQLHAQFVPEGMMSEDVFHSNVDEKVILSGDIVATSLTYIDDDVRLIDSANFTITAQKTTLITSSSGASRDVMAKLLSRLQVQTKGTLMVGDHKLTNVFEANTGQQISYLPENTSFFNQSIGEILFMGLRQTPPTEADMDEKRQQNFEEAAASGNSLLNVHLDWTNYTLANASEYEELHQHAVEILDNVELTDDFFTLGLRQTVALDRNKKLTDGAMEARQKLWAYLEEHGISDLVKPYNFDTYNEYSTLHENILFGRAKTDAFNDRNLMKQPQIRALLIEHNLYDQFLTIGLRGAEIMVDMFKGIAPGHTFFEQFSFVDEDTLPTLKEVVNHAKSDELSSLSEDEKDLLLALPLRLVPQRHRLGLIDTKTRAKVVTFRKDLHTKHPELFKNDIQAFDSEHYNENLSIQDNILFGSIAFGRADAQSRIENALKTISTAIGISALITRAAFKFEVGIGGARLSSVQKQKLTLAQNLLKNPKIIIINDGLSSIDTKTQERLSARLTKICKDVTMIWISASEPIGVEFDHHLEITNGKVNLVNGDTQQDEKASLAEVSSMGAEAMILKNLPLFAELEPSQLKLLAFTAERKHYFEGETLFRQGEDGDSAYVILEGQADVVLEDGEGGETILFTLPRNKLVGELALLCDTKRTATIRACGGELTALQLNADVFAQLARNDANFSYQMTRDLSQRLVDTTAELNAAK